MPVFYDQLNRSVHVPSLPQRIVSLVPSQTELLAALGLEEEVVGITKFCVHPPNWFRQKQRIGGTKNIDVKKIVSLQPDLVIANKEENVKEQVEELARHLPVWVSDVNTLADALDMITGIGNITNRLQAANALTTDIGSRFAQLKTPGRQPLTAYLIWKNPYMTVGGDTFIHHMLQQAGFKNLFAGNGRYPTTSLEELQSKNCEVLLLSSEPYPFKQKHVDELRTLLPAIKILVVDGELFSWYGSRLLQAPAYFSAVQQQVGCMP